MNTWTIHYTEKDGKPVRLPLIHDLGEAEYTLGFIHKRIDPDAVLIDVVEEAAARLPVGSRIRHTTSGRAGIVAEEDASLAPFSGAPAGTLVSHYVTNQYTAVCVRFDDRSSPQWFDAAFIAPENGETQ